MEKMKKILFTSVMAVVLSVSLLLIENNFVCMAAQAAEEIPKGYTPIYTIEDLRAINNGTPVEDEDGMYEYDEGYLDGKYILMNDIDMSETAPGGAWDTGNGWLPIGGFGHQDFYGNSYSEAFTGTFDGNGHYIKNMHIYGDMDCGAGLFSLIDEGAEITDLGIVDCEIDVEAALGVGAIAGVTEGNGPDISRCFVSGNIRKTSRHAYEEKDDYGGVGGFIGSGRAVFSDCYSTADISAPQKCGGIIGGTDRGYFCIKNCYNAGLVHDDSGISRRLSGNWRSENSFGEGIYYLDSPGLVKDTGEEDYIEKSVPLTEAQMQKEGCFNGFDFKKTWYMDAAGAYGYPQLRSCPQKRVSGCEIKKLPDKLVYDYGDKLNLSGGILSVFYEDGVKSDIQLEEDMVSGYEGEKSGKQTIYISYANGTTSFEVEVKEVDVENLEFDCGEKVINRGDKFQITASFTPSNTTNKDLTWETDNELVASVSENGEVKGINAGTAVISAKTANGIQALCTVEVKVPAKKIKLNVTELQMKKGEKKEIRASMTPLDTTDTITWMSSNSKIASVSSKGVVTAKKQGSAVILAKTSSGISKKVKVNVTGQKAVAKKLNRDQARKELVKWLKRNNQYNKKYILAYNKKDGNTYVYHYYEDMPTHVATVNWYYVNSRTGKITSEFKK